jgi:hypothetical protein
MAIQTPIKRTGKSPKKSAIASPSAITSNAGMSVGALKSRDKEGCSLLIVLGNDEK